MQSQLTEDWARKLRDQCHRYGTAFFYKQGSHRFSGRNTTLDGMEWKQFPKLVEDAKA